MKIGIQTIAWTHTNLSLAAMIEESLRIGFDGIEVFQNVPQDLIGSLPSKDRIFGFAGGSIADRLATADALQRLTGRSDDLPIYVYVDNWGDNEHALYKKMNQNIVIAVHPHMFKPIQTVHESLEVLKKYPYTKLLLDTGHLAVAGVDPIPAIEANFDRLIGVHLKDWTPEFGRSYPFYSSGFCCIGQGKVEIESVVNLLKKLDFDGYVIVEQDFTSEPFVSMTSARKLLKKLGI